MQLKYLTFVMFILIASFVVAEENSTNSSSDELQPVLISEPVEMNKADIIAANVQEIETYHVVPPRADCDVLCWDGSCSDGVSSCPKPFACPESLPYLCSNGACSATEEGCELSDECEVKCITGECVDSLDSCEETEGCPSVAPFACLDGRCVNDLSVCPGAPKCENVMCPDGVCTDSLDDCSENEECTLVKPFMCSDGSCSVRVQDCYPLEFSDSLSNTYTAQVSLLRAKLQEDENARVSRITEEQIEARRAKVEKLMEEEEKEEMEEVDERRQRALEAIEAARLARDGSGESEESKPKEIVVVGDNVKAVVIDGFSDTQVSTDEELVDFAEFLAASDDFLDKIVLKEDSITMNYRRPAKMFGFIPANYNVEATVSTEELGRIKLKTPWWLAISSHDHKEVVADLKAEFRSDTEFRDVDLENDLAVQARSLYVLTSIMQADHTPADEES